MNFGSATPTDEGPNAAHKLAVMARIRIISSMEYFTADMDLRLGFGQERLRNAAIAIPLFVLMNKTGFYR
jgi:hypothetical protein